MRSYDLGKLSILVLEKHLLVRRLLADVFSDFFGPDRRRSRDEFYGGLNRRKHCTG